MEDKQPQRHDQEVMDMGATALMNSDSPNQEAPLQEAQPTPPSDEKPFKKIGSFALSKADQKLLEPDEHLVSVVRRHPIGLLGIYLEMFTGIAGVVTLAILAMFVFFSQLSASARGLIVVGAVFMVSFLLALLAIATKVYRQCRLIVTDISLVQVVQHALFNRKVSRLSMSNVEDVNAEQNGILPNLFNYGTVTIQTAGQEDNFIFSYCPDPDKFADRILQARQQYVRHLGEHPIPE